MRRWCLPLQLIVATAACGPVVTPSSPSSPNASGTWSGNVTVQSAIGQMTWVLTQNGTQVAGAVKVKSRDGSGLLSGTLAGVLTGATLTYAIAIEAGGLAPDATCAGRLEGTATLARGVPSTLTGTYTEAAASCLTEFARGNFVLTSGPAAFVAQYAPS